MKMLTSQAIHRLHVLAGHNGGLRGHFELFFVVLFELFGGASRRAKYSEFEMFPGYQACASMGS